MTIKLFYDTLELNTPPRIHRVDISNQYQTVWIQGYHDGFVLQRKLWFWCCWPCVVSGVSGCLFKIFYRFYFLLNCARGS